MTTAPLIPTTHSRRAPASRRLLAAPVALLCAALGCSSGKTGGGSTAAADARVLERHRLDLDGDGVADEMRVMRADSSDPGATERIELQLSRAGARVLADSDRWDPAPDEWNGYGNLLPSHLVYVADYERAGRLLFLFGARSGCCAQGLTIYRLGANGPEPYFHEAELFVDRTPVPQPGKVATLAGRRLSEAAAAPAGDYVSAVTYAPVIAWRLEERPVVDSAATRALTREELGGFAGFAYRTDVTALRRRDGARLLWDTRARRPLP